MALVKCMECGGVVSDKASACPHCGAPVQPAENNICVINGVERDLTKILELSRQGHVGPPRGEAWQILVGGHILGENDLDDFYGLWGFICKTGKIPPVFNDGDGAVLGAQAANENLPKCPTCGSTHLTKITAWDRGVAAGLFGGISKTARSQFKCENCGYMF